MMFLGATNVIASRPPERRPTGTPHARAKILPWGVMWLQHFKPTYIGAQSKLTLKLQLQNKHI